MSSKLLRGGQIGTEPVAWRHVSSSDVVGGDLPPVPSYISEPGLTQGQNKAADLEHQIGLAHKRGFEEGQAAARQGLAGQLESMQMKVARSIEELTGSRLRYRRQAEHDVVALALAVARRILHRELTMAPEALLGLVKAALDKLEAREIHQVHVSRGDAPMLRQFLDQMGMPQKVEVIPDAELAPGAVLIESSRGLLDASVDTQLSEIERGFADLVKISS